MDGRKISPFYRTLSPTMAAAQKERRKRKKEGKDNFPPQYVGPRVPCGVPTGPYRAQESPMGPYGAPIGPYWAPIGPYGAQNNLSVGP